MNRDDSFVPRIGPIVLLAALLGACAHAPPASEAEAYAEFRQRNDPLEPMNRAIFAANMQFDSWILGPVTKTYIGLVPDPGRKGLTNFLANLTEPWTATNDLLQGKPGAAGRALSRFLVNSTVGIGGLFDPATKYWKIERHDEDLGQTLAVWGVPAGPYLMLPVFGPSNFRDATGFVGEIVLDPVDAAIDRANIANIGGTDISALSVARLSLKLLDRRARNDAIFDELHRSDDSYVLVRSAYRQHRAFEISDGRALTNPEEEAMFNEPD